jgi:hypothetical protein
MREPILSGVEGTHDEDRDFMREFLDGSVAEAYVPPAAPDPETLPDPGPLPPGSRVPFRRNASFTGRAEHLKALARYLLHGEEATLVTQAVDGYGASARPSSPSSWYVSMTLAQL